MLGSKRFRMIYAASLGVALLAVIVVVLRSPKVGLIVAAVVAASEGLVYFVFLRPLFQAGRIVETGVPAEAEILEVSDTGTTINMDPQVRFKLRVHPKSGEPYETETKAVVSRLKVHEFQPGAWIEVMVDPADPRLVAVVSGEEVSVRSIADLGAGSAGSLKAPASEDGVRQTSEMIGNIDKANRAVLASGNPAEALILQATDLGIKVNGPNPAMRLLLEVRPDDRPSFRAEATCVVAEKSVQKYQAGRTIFVKYEPDDLTRVAVDHS